MTDRLPLNSALVGAVAVTAALEAAYYFGGLAGVPDDTPLRAAAVATAVAALTALALWRWCRNSELSARSGLLGVLALVSFLGVWVGVFGPVCAAAVVAGSSAIAAGRTRSGWFATGAGVVVALAGATVCVLGAT
jgi:hypothetical protein